jgi:hypothetical protein
MRVILESPYAGREELYTGYGRRCLKHSLGMGEAPLAMHLLYTQPGILRDHEPSERKRGMDAGREWVAVAEKVVVYIDHGISKGMEAGIQSGHEAGLEIEFRNIGQYGES